MPDLSTIIQVGSFPISIMALIIAYFSFTYGRKPLIHINSNKINDYEFIIKNVSKNPAKDIRAKIKLIHNENTHDIGEYKLDYSNPEDEDVIRDISDRIESKLENLKLLIKAESKCPKEPKFCRTDMEIQAIKENVYSDEELQAISSHRIDNNFKINIEFEITCKADIPISWEHKFRYNFEVSYTELNLDDIIEPERSSAILYGWEDDFELTIKPSTGKWK